MLTMTEYLRRSTNPLEKGIIELYAKNSSVLQYLPFQNIKGNTYTKRIESVLSGVGTRSINEDYSESTSTTDKKSAELKMMGGKAKIDRFQIVTQSGDATSLLAEEIESKTKAASLFFTKLFFLGDNSVNDEEFNGLEIQVSNIVDCGDSDGGDSLTLDRLDALIDSVAGTPTCLWMNKTLRRKVNNLMRESSQALEMIKDNFGRLIPYYAGIPIGIVEVDNNYNEILDFSEPDCNGSGDACSSIYACRMGKDGLHGLQASPIIVDDQGWVNNWRQVVFDWFVTIFIGHPQSVGRLRGIKNDLAVSGGTQTTTTTV